MRPAATSKAQGETLYGIQYLRAFAALAVVPSSLVHGSVRIAAHR